MQHNNQSPILSYQGKQKTTY